MTLVVIYYTLLHFVLLIPHIYLQIRTCIDTILGDLGVLGDDPLGLVVLNCLYSFCGEVIEDEDVVEEEVVGEELLRGGGGELLSVLV